MPSRDVCFLAQTSLDGLIFQTKLILHSVDDSTEVAVDLAEAVPNHPGLVPEDSHACINGGGRGGGDGNFRAGSVLSFSQICGIMIGVTGRVTREIVKKT